MRHKRHSAWDRCRSMCRMCRMFRNFRQGRAKGIAIPTNRAPNRATPMKTFRIQLHCMSGDPEAYRATANLYEAVKHAVLCIPGIHMVTVDSIEGLPTVELPVTSNAKPKLRLRNRPVPHDQPRA